MRTPPPLQLLALFALVAMAPATLTGCSKGFGPNFEGEIAMQMRRGSAAPTTMTIKAKGDKLRLEMPAPIGEPRSAIYLGHENKMVVLLAAQKAAMDVNLAAPGAPQPNTNAQTSAIDKTGKKETIAGVTCEDWVIKDPSGSRTETCVADGLAYLDLDSLRRGTAGGPSWKAEMRANKTFPLRSVEYDKDGKESTRVEVTEVKREKLDDSLFEVPAGYARMPVKR
jgi:hypothetical protein